jgi:hypothetical protein
MAIYHSAMLTGLLLLLQVFAVQEDPEPRRPELPAPASSPIEVELYDNFSLRLQAIVMSLSLQLPRRVDTHPFALDGKGGGGRVEFDSVGLGTLVGFDITFDLNAFRFFTEFAQGGAEEDVFPFAGATGAIDYSTYAVRVGLERPVIGVRMGSLRLALGPGLGFVNISAKPSSNELVSQRQEFNGLFLRVALHADVRLYQRLYLMVGVNADLLVGEAQGVPVVVNVGLVWSF